MFKIIIDGTKYNPLVAFLFGSKIEVYDFRSSVVKRTDYDYNSEFMGFKLEHLVPNGCEYFMHVITTDRKLICVTYNRNHSIEDYDVYPEVNIEYSRTTFCANLYELHKI